MPICMVNSMSLVSLAKVRKTTGTFTEAILHCLRLIQYQFPKEIERVVIKPNMCYYYDYSTGQTTDPRFVAAIINIIRSQASPNVDISVVESDASAMKCKYAFRFLGYERMAQQCGVELVNLSKDEVEKVEVTAGGKSFSFMVPQTIKNADLRVNVPKIKYMPKTKISCSLKNIFGCNPYQKKFRYHDDLGEAIVALSKVMNFDLCILDGIIVSGSYPYKMGLVMASQDPVALDAAAAKIAGVNPNSVKHITLAAKEGIGSVSFTWKGIDPAFFQKRYPRMGVGYKILNLGYGLAFKLGLAERLGISD